MLVKKGLWVSSMNSLEFPASVLEAVSGKGSDCPLGPLWALLRGPVCYWLWGVYLGCRLWCKEQPTAIPRGADGSVPAPPAGPLGLGSDNDQGQTGLFSALSGSTRHLIVIAWAQGLWDRMLLEWLAPRMNEWWGFGWGGGEQEKEKNAERASF